MTIQIKPTKNIIYNGHSPRLLDGKMLFMPVQVGDKLKGEKMTACVSKVLRCSHKLPELFQCNLPWILQAFGLYWTDQPCFAKKDEKSHSFGDFDDGVPQNPP